MIKWLRENLVILLMLIILRSPMLSKKKKNQNLGSAESTRVGINLCMQIAFDQYVGCLIFLVFNQPCRILVGWLWDCFSSICTASGLSLWSLLSKSCVDHKETPQCASRMALYVVHFQFFLLFGGIWSMRRIALLPLIFLLARMRWFVELI